jgi:hypothetical protein
MQQWTLTLQWNLHNTMQVGGFVENSEYTSCIPLDFSPAPFDIDIVDIIETISWNQWNGDLLSLIPPKGAIDLQMVHRNNAHEASWAAIASHYGTFPFNFPGWVGVLIRWKGTFLAAGGFLIAFLVFSDGTVGPVDGDIECFKPMTTTFKKG